jgi:hypothetical protein
VFDRAGDLMAKYEDRSKIPTLNMDKQFRVENLLPAFDIKIVNQFQ